jgi:hypothetical protein
MKTQLVEDEADAVEAVAEVAVDVAEVAEPVADEVAEGVTKSLLRIACMDRKRVPTETMTTPNT